MKKIFDLAFRKARGKVNANLYADESDNVVDIVKILRENFGNAKDGMVCVRIIADDRTEKEEAFNADLAKEILTGQKKGRFITSKGECVELLSCSLKGDYPFLGVYDGTPMQWNEEGCLMNATEENPAYRIRIVTSIKKNK